MTITGNIIDIQNRTIFHGTITVTEGIIQSIVPVPGESKQYILPGFVDAHIHIESSMLVPSEFAKMAVVHGTVATVSDPHEIANVMGMEGVEYMIENGKKVPLKFNFGAPSCVPATTFETAGATLDVADIETLMKNPEVRYLAEMMNYPGVLFEDKMVMEKIATAHRYGKPIDGHAPGLRGADAKKYIGAGISTDHECFTKEEALDKLEYGMKILIREGSAAKNFNALVDLIPKFADRMMFCSDDKHPDDLLEGHINQLVSRAVAKGYDLYDILQVACINAVEHYGLSVGVLKPGDPADFIIVEDLATFEIKQTYIDGELVAKNGHCAFQTEKAPVINNFNTSKKSVKDFQITTDKNEIQVIKAINGEIVTETFWAKVKRQDGWIVSDTKRDILKMTVVNRYENQPPAIAFINNFNLQHGAIASCVGHDSHNIIAVGVDDESITQAVNLIIENKGGISAVGKETKHILPLPVAGIMTNADGKAVAAQYLEIDNIVKKQLGTQLAAPFMTLSFMALLVIPQLKLSNLGLFDGKNFEFTPLFR